MCQMKTGPIRQVCHISLKVGGNLLSHSRPFHPELVKRTQRRPRVAQAICFFVADGWDDGQQPDPCLFPVLSLFPGERTLLWP